MPAINHRNKRGSQNEPDRVISSVKVLQNQTRVRGAYDFDKYRLMFWTDEELEAVARASRLINIPGSRESGRLECQLIVEHPAYEMPITADFNFDVIPHEVKGSVLWPNFEKIKIPESCELHEQLVNTVVSAIDRGTFQAVVNWLVTYCKTWEQVRYAFPPILGLLRRADMGDIANKIEAIKRPAPVNIPGHIRRQIQHCIQWCAIQEMFDWAPPVTPQGNIQFELVSDMTLERNIDDKVYYVSLKY